MDEARVREVLNAQHRLEAIEGVSRVDVHLDASLDWHPDAMSGDYRRRLAAHRAANRPPNDR